MLTRDVRPAVAAETKPAVPAQTNHPANPVLLILRRIAFSVRTAADFSSSDATLTYGPACT